MGKLTLSKKKKIDAYFVEAVWERRADEEDGGVVKYLTSWIGYSEKTWEPVENFNAEVLHMVRELDCILDDPANHERPSWLIEHERLKAAGVNIIKRTPKSARSLLVSADAATAAEQEEEPVSKRERRDDSSSTPVGDAAGRTARAQSNTVADVIRRKKARAGTTTPRSEATPTRALLPRAIAVAADGSLTPAETPQRSLDTSRASSRPEEEERAASEERVGGGPAENEESSSREVDERVPSSSSAVLPTPADGPSPSPTELNVEVARNEMRVPLSITTPALASPSSLTAASPASTVLSTSKIDATTGILLPLLPSDFVPFDWAAYMAREGGMPAPIEAFWKRRVEQFKNPFGAHIGKLIKVPDNDETFDNEWCTIGQVKAVHGPWVQIHALDTDAALAHWYMADDTGLQPFVNITDKAAPKWKEPNKRRSTGNYTRMIERAMFAADGTDLRVPDECFDQLPWKNRPMTCHFKVGHKLETYDPVRGEGCFYPATIVEVHTAKEGKETVKFHFDGYPDSHTKTVSYKDYRLFPCGFAAAIGWKCILPEGMIRKQENRGRKKTSGVGGASAAGGPVSPSGQQLPSPRPQQLQLPNNNNDKMQQPPQLIHHPRKSDQPSRSGLRTAERSIYKEASTESENDDEEEEEEREEARYVSNNQHHRTRAPAIPGLLRRGGEQPRKVEERKENMKRETKKEEIKDERSGEPPAKMTRPAPSWSPLTLDHFAEQSTSKGPPAQSELPITSVRMVHTGNQVFVFLNHECNVGVNIHPSCFKMIPSKSLGSLPHVWREILQQLLNASVDPKKFISCVPKHVLNGYPTMSISYDESRTETICHFVCPPPNVHDAKRLLTTILVKAGICKNAVTFDARRICEDCKKKVEESKVYDILRGARQEEMNDHRHPHRQQQLLQPAPPPPSQHHHHHQMLQQQQQQHHMQQQQQRHQQKLLQAQQQQRSMMQPMQPPPVARVAPSTPSGLLQMQQQQHQQRQLPSQLIRHQQHQQRGGLQPQPQQQPLLQPVHRSSGGTPPVAPAAVAAGAAATAAAAPSAQPVLQDDPGRFLNQRVNINALTDHEIIECLTALRVPPDVIHIFKKMKINYRSLPLLKEETMVQSMLIPRQWAQVIAKFVADNAQPE